MLYFCHWITPSSPFVFQLLAMRLLTAFAGCVVLYVIVLLSLKTQNSEDPSEFQRQNEWNMALHLRINISLWSDLFQHSSTKLKLWTKICFSFSSKYCLPTWPVSEESGQLKLVLVCCSINAVGCPGGKRWKVCVCVCVWERCYECVWTWEQLSDRQKVRNVLLIFRPLQEIKQCNINCHSSQLNG